MKFDDDVCVHYLNPDFSRNFLSDEDVRFHIELPYPIHKPFKISQIDKINKYRENLEAYSSQLLTLSKEFQSFKSEVMDQSFTDSHARIPGGLLELCNSKGWEVPYSCDYNPYYATGLLEHFCLNSTEYLIRPDSKNNLRLTDLLKPWKSPKLHVDWHLTDISGISVTSNNRLLLRRRNEVDVIEIKDVAEVATLTWTKKFKRDLLDAKSHEPTVGVITANLKYRLYDIETGKKLDANNDGAIRFDFVNNDGISLLSRQRLKILDRRSGDCQLLEPELDDCNSLCSVKFDDNLVYLSSRHYLMRSDLRFFKDVEFCTHLMKFSPCYMGLETNSKVLCLANQKVEEKALFGGEPISSLPMTVPSICDSLRLCRLTKDILLKDGLDERLAKSVAGIKLLRHDDEVFLYSVNSSGEIFKQKITKEVVREESTSIDSLHHWVSKLKDVSKPLYLTNLANMSDARFILNKRIQDERLSKFKRQNKKATLFLNHFNNVYNKNNLGELATNFVSIWEVEEEEKEETSLVPEVAPIDKVTNWIESNYFLDQ